MRQYAERIYGIPPEQVVGSTGETSFGYSKDGKPILTKDPKLLLNQRPRASRSVFICRLASDHTQRSEIRPATGKC